MQHKKTIHPLFARFVPPRKDRIKDHALLLVFRRGQAGKDQYDELTRMVNTIMMLGIMQGNRDIQAQAEKLKTFVTDIYNRYQAKQSFTLNSDGLATLTDLVLQYDDFIREQAPDVIERARKELILFENDLAAERLKAA